MTYISSHKTPPIIIFDFDDLLVNSCHVHERAFEDALEKAGVCEKIPSELYASFFGLRIIDISRGLQKHFKFAMPIEEFVRMRDARFIELVREELELMPGARELAELVKRKGWRRALASSGTREYLDVGLKKTGFEGFFEVIASGDEVQRGKPAPDIFLIAAKKLKVNPSECIVIEDSESGILAAKAAGMKCIGVANPFSAIKQDLSKADIAVGSLKEIDERVVVSLRFGLHGIPAYSMPE